MKKYQYQIVRYIHDLVTGEFVNVGIIIYQKETRFLDAKFISKYSRLSNFYSHVNGHYLISTLKNLKSGLKKVSQNFETLFSDEYNSIVDITKSILQIDDSSLVCSEIKYCLDLDPSKALNDLFDRLVNKYTLETDKEIVSDSKVWRTVYKRYFDKYEITNKLKPHTVKTSHDSIEFDKAWKNGKWNCYQTLSFDLKKADAIKNKVYKWSGILKELENSKEGIHVYLLTNTPKHNKTISKFIFDTLGSKKTESIQVTLITEKEAEQFAKKVKHELELHNY